MRSLKLFGLAALAWTCAYADAQEALAAGGPYKLVSADTQGSFVLSGMRHGAEPGSTEAWIWTIYLAPKVLDGEIHDALAQRAVFRCESKSVEIVGAEYYLNSEGRTAPYQQRVPQTPRPGTPMERVWKMACDFSVRFQAANFSNLGEIDSEIRRRLGVTASAAVQSGSRPDP